MVYKKYIKRNGKVYGPYLYSNKRIGDKIITSYVGRGMEKNSGRKKFLAYYWVVLIFVFSLALFLNNLNLTGFQILENADSKLEIVDKLPIPVVVEDEILINGGEEIEEPLKNVEDYNEVKEVSAGKKVKLKKMNIEVEVVEGSAVVSEAEVGDTNIVGRPVDWSMGIKADLPEDEQVKIKFPSTAGHIRVDKLDGVGSGDVVIKAGNLKKTEKSENVFEAIRKLLKFEESSTGEVSVGSGGYQISFTTQRVSQSLKKVEKGSIIELINLGDVGYENLVTVSEIGFNSELGSIRIADEKDNEINFEEFDLNGDGGINLVKFTVDIPSKSKKIFKVSQKIGYEDIGEIDEEIMLSPEEIDVSEECKIDLICSGFSECGSNEDANNLLIDVDIKRVKERLCFSREGLKNCPPIVKKISECKVISEKEIVVETREISLSPGQIEEEFEEERGEVRVKEIVIKDKRESIEKEIAVIEVKKTDSGRKIVDVIFS